MRHGKTFVTNIEMQRNFLTKTSTKTRQPCIVEDCVTFYKTNFQQFKPWSEIVICSSSFTLSSWNFHPSCPSILSMNLIWWLSHLWKNMLGKWKSFPQVEVQNISIQIFEKPTLKLYLENDVLLQTHPPKKTCPKNQYLSTLVFSLQQKHIPWCKKQQKKTCQPTTWRVQFFGGQTMINVQPTKKH